MAVLTLTSPAVVRRKVAGCSFRASRSTFGATDLKLRNHRDKNPQENHRKFLVKRKEKKNPHKNPMVLIMVLHFTQNIDLLVLAANG